MASLPGARARAGAVGAGVERRAGRALAKPWEKVDNIIELQMRHLRTHIHISASPASGVSALLLKFRQLCCTIITRYM